MADEKTVAFLSDILGSQRDVAEWGHVFLFFFFSFQCFCSGLDCGTRGINCVFVITNKKNFIFAERAGRLRLVLCCMVVPGTGVGSVCESSRV